MIEGLVRMENDDWKIKWSFDKDKLELTKWGIDTFTEKTYKIVYQKTIKYFLALYRVPIRCVFYVYSYLNHRL